VTAVGDRTLRFVRDSLYVAVGFGVLTVQKAQVRRRELERALDGPISALREPLAKVVSRGGTDDPDARHP
jgi:hypothetical protein